VLPDALVFDLDGTIADTESIEYASVAAVWSARGLAYPVERWADAVGLSWSPAWAEELRGVLAASGAPVPEAAALHDEQHAAKAELLGSLEPRPGVVALVEAAAGAGIPMAVASNSPLRWVQARLEQLRLATRFTALLALDVATHPKPHPAPYLEACAALGARPGRSVAFEDSTIGTASAVAAGLCTIACPGPLTDGHDLSLAHLRIGSHDELALVDVVEALQAFVSGRRSGRGPRASRPASPRSPR